MSAGDFIDGQTLDASGMGEINDEQTRRMSRKVGNMPVLLQAVVVDVLYDPAVLTEEQLYKASFCKNSKYLSTIPRNTLIVRLVQGGAGKKNKSSWLSYPLFPPHLCMPIKPTETVWLIDPMPGQNSDMKYWVCRKPAPDFVDDLNLTANDRTVADSSQKSDKAPTNAAGVPTPGFPNGTGDGEGYTLNPPWAYEEYYMTSTAMHACTLESVPRFINRPSDMTLQGSNNTLICLGEDRGYTVDNRPLDSPADPESTSANKSNANTNPSGDAEAGNFQPFNVASEPQYRGTIDIVVGRGQSVGTEPQKIENAWMNEEVVKNYANFGGNSDVKNNRYILPAEGDPDFIDDLSRVYISMKTSGDKNLGLEYPGFVGTPIDDKPYVIVKSEEVRLVARENIRLVAPVCGIVADATVGVEAPTIIIGSGSPSQTFIGDGAVEPLVLGIQLLNELTARIAEIDSFIKAFNEHTHTNSAGATVPKNEADVVTITPLTTVWHSIVGFIK